MNIINFRNDVLPLKDRLFRLALHITLDRAEAEDITQETLIRVWEKRSEWQEIENIGAYAATICRRMALDYARKTERFKSEDIGTAHTALHATAAETALPDEMLDRRQRLHRVRQLIDRLPETQRSIMLLRDIEGMRYDEVARTLQLTETQVKVYLHRARNKIRTELEKIDQYGL